MFKNLLLFKINLSPFKRSQKKTIKIFKNLLEILFLLQNTFQDPQIWFEGINYPLESATERKIRTQAVCSPAYITLYCEVSCYYIEQILDFYTMLYKYILPATKISTL